MILHSSCRVLIPYATIILVLTYLRAAWGKANKVFNNEILFLSDPLAAFSKSIGWSSGIQANRYAILLNQGNVVYAGKDERGQISVSRDRFKSHLIGSVLS